MNELSFYRRCLTPESFCEKFGELARKRASTRILRDRLFCSRDLIACPVTASESVGDAIYRMAPPARSVILAWLAKQGPFWEDGRLSEKDDYFELDGHDVTNMGLGEAARSMKISLPSGVFSFRFDGDPDCEPDPLRVQHGLTEEVLGYYPVPNEKDLESLAARIAETASPPTSWLELEQRSRLTFDNLWFSPECFSPVSRLAFNPAAADRAVALFSILNEYAGDLQDDGSRGGRAAELYQLHWTGDSAAFSDEAEGNKRDFRNEMTFHDPDRGEDVFCPWHGKIKTEQFRFHFEWPPAVTKEIRLFYFGPKITRR